MNLDWQKDAACAGHDPELWFARTLSEMKEAKSICDACPVKKQCAEFSTNEHWGIWAGLDREEEYAENAVKRQNESRVRQAQITAEAARLERKRKSVVDRQIRELSAQYRAGHVTAETRKAYERHQRRLEQNRESERRRRQRMYAADARYKAGDRDKEAEWGHRLVQQKNTRDRAAWRRAENTKKEIA